MAKWLKKFGSPFEADLVNSLIKDIENSKKNVLDRLQVLEGKRQGEIYDNTNAIKRETQATRLTAAETKFEVSVVKTEVSSGFSQMSENFATANTELAAVLGEIRVLSKYAAAMRSDVSVIQTELYKLVSEKTHMERESLERPMPVLVFDRLSIGVPRSS